MDRDYIVSVDENGRPYLSHYGVIGMRWGVRHDPKAAYDKAAKKFNRLASKSDKAIDKAGKYNRKVNARRFGSGKSDAEKGRRAYRKAMKNANKAAKWLKSMEKSFSKQSVVSIDPGLVSKGNDMLERYRMLSIGGIFYH